MDALPVEQLQLRLAVLDKLILAHKKPDDITLSRTKFKLQQKQLKEMDRICSNLERLGVSVSTEDGYRISGTEPYTSHSIPIGHTIDKMRPVIENQSRIDRNIPQAYSEFAEQVVTTQPVETIGHRALLVPPEPNLPFEKRKRELLKPRDKVVSPSALSGGVPEPHISYMRLASSPFVARLNLQPILVVIDLNGTLLFRPKRDAPTTFTERPFAQHFLHYMFCNFTVMIWSSARPQNVTNMCERLFSPEQKSRLVATWGRDRFGLTPEDYNRRVQVYKRLDRVWADPDIRAAHPDYAHGGGWDQKNTILIDDSLEKARSEPFNLVPCPEFFGGREDPHILRKVAEYLDGVKFSDNVSSYMKSNPFALSNADEVAARQTWSSV